MMLVEQTTVPIAALPVAQFKDHLRLGTGFADDGVQDNVLESYLRAAMAAIEARTGKILITRSFTWTLTAWRDLATQALPVGPVSAITGLTITDRLGADEVISSDRYRLEKDLHRPKLVSTGICLPAIPVAGEVEIGFDAGFGADWADIPADLAQAVLMLAAYYYENRSDMSAGAGDLPFGVTALIQRYRVVRLFGGGGAQ
ncbi:head-tail connector protein [Aliiroseovarius crassostreae]|uniref:head-tail connector protein n=1 Tax=Aliiroseovarius crassostreae TaxID=154981 RepID=UPI0021AF1EA5|nr:head-tail connector protein [Aliiroseovarius crassostreae]UWQ08993.1 head-tail connector protein [Aliiroseovarius crassostreae]UWQ12074.1 head-tail connector protein [Aliiroseovarius crassostreae]